MLRLLLVVSVVLALGVGVSGAFAGEGSPPNPRGLCTKGHWQQFGFKSESKCLNALQSGQQHCKAVQATFGVDNQTGLDLAGTILVWTCNGDGIVTGGVADLLRADCDVLGDSSSVLGNGSAFTSSGTEGAAAFACFVF